MSKVKIAVLLLLLAAALLLAALALCGAKRYRVDYCGAKELFQRARDSYRAGSTVTLYYPHVATDTDYTIYLNGEPIRYTYDDRRGFIITFVMPAHDVRLEVESRNTMVCLPESGMAEETLLLEYREETVALPGEDADSCELVLAASSDSDVLCLTVYTSCQEPVSYSVPYEAYERCFAVIQENQMEAWVLSPDAVSLEGARITLCYFDAGFTVQVSSDAMPQHGEQVFAQLKGILQAYAVEENRI